MPRSRVLPRAIVLVLAATLAATGCVTLDLREATEPYIGRTLPGAPTIAIAEATDRRDEPKRFGRVGWNVFRFSGGAGQKFRNALMSALADQGYNVRFVGYKNVLSYEETARAIEETDADALLTAAVLELRVFSTDPFFDPADIDFIAQVSLLDRDGRTVYTRHIHAHEEKRLWFNPAFGAMDVLDEVMARTAEYVAGDAELERAMSAVRKPAPKTITSRDPEPGNGGLPADLPDDASGRAPKETAR